MQLFVPSLKFILPTYSLVGMYTILTKVRNRMKDGTGIALLRGYENLHHIMHAKKMLGKRISETL